MFRLRRTCLALFLFAFSIFAAAQDFTIVALPDTQHYSQSYPQIFNSQTQWIKDNVSALNIRLVLGEGDIVNGGGDIGQWHVAASFAGDGGHGASSAACDFRVTA